MSKFNTATIRTAVSSPVATERAPSGPTFEGAPGYARDLCSELFLLAVTNMVGEQTFYEKTTDRDNRFIELVHEVAVTDWPWLAGFLPWLRSDGNMRSAPVVAALEGVKARLEAKVGPATEGTLTPRQLVAAVMLRADEPGEALAYWLSRYGKPVPIAVKRGLADAVYRLYTEQSMLKYDTSSHAVRFGDVVDLVRPAYRRPEVCGTWRYDLYGHALDRRHNREKPIPASLEMLNHRALLMAIIRPEMRRALLNPVTLAAAGMTWEALAGWLQGPMDRQAWEAVLPSMGYMARLRNLRNFDEAGVSDEVAEQIAAQLSDPDEVAKSRQLPLRFLSAYRAAPSLRWGHALDKALTASVANIPQLPGRTLILVDTSGSMNDTFSKDGTLKRWDAATTFSLALARRCTEADVVSFSGTGGWGSTSTRTKEFPKIAGESLLLGLKRWETGGYFLGGGTDTAGAVRKHYANHDRVVILTDEQAAYHGHGDVTAAVPQHRPVYTWNLAGYKRGHAPSGTGSRHTFGGLTDSAFGMIPLLEAGSSCAWPWL